MEKSYLDSEKLSVGEYANDFDFLLSEQSFCKFKRIISRDLESLYKGKYTELERNNFEEDSLEQIIDSRFITYILFRVVYLDNEELFSKVLNNCDLEKLKKDELIFLYLIFRDNKQYLESKELIFLYFDKYGFNLTFLYILLESKAGLNYLLNYLSNNNIFSENEENDTYIYSQISINDDDYTYKENIQKLYKYIDGLVDKCKFENFSYKILSAIYKILGDFYNYISIDRDEQKALKYYGLSYMLGDYSSLGEISEIYIEMGDYEKAISYGNIGIINGISKCYEMLLISYLKLGEFSKAEKVLHSSIAKGISNHSRLSIYYYTAFYHYHKSEGNSKEAYENYTIAKKLLTKKIFNMDEDERLEIMEDDDYRDFFIPDNNRIESISKEGDFKQLSIFRELSIGSLNHNRLLFYFNKLTDIINLLLLEDDINKQKLFLSTIKNFLLDKHGELIKDKVSEKFILNKIDSYLGIHMITKKMNLKSRQKVFFDIIGVFLNYEYSVLMKNFDTCIEFKESIKIIGLLLNSIGHYNSSVSNSQHFSDLEISKTMDVSMEHGIKDLLNITNFGVSKPATRSKEDLLKLYKKTGNVDVLLQLLNFIDNENEIYLLLDISIRLGVEKAELHILDYLIKGGISYGSKLFNTCKQLYMICISKGYIGYLYNNIYRTLYLDYYNEVVELGKRGLITEYLVGLDNLVFVYNDVRSSILLLEKLINIKNQLLNKSYNSYLFLSVIKYLNIIEDNDLDTNIYVNENMIIGALLNKINIIKSIKLDVPDTYLMRSRELNTIGILVGDNNSNSGLEIIYID